MKAGRPPAEIPDYGARPNYWRPTNDSLGNGGHSQEEDIGGRRIDGNLTHPTTIPLLSDAGEPPNRQIPATLVGNGKVSVSVPMGRPRNSQGRNGWMGGQRGRVFTKAKEKDDKDDQSWKPAV